MNTVVELRRAGNKVRVTHMRWNMPVWTDDMTGMMLMSRHEAGEAGLIWEPSSKGGLTIVEITTPDGKSLRGESLCSYKDGYCRKFGVQAALQRALGDKPALSVHGETRRIVESISVPLEDNIRD
jgi:hypothetical protein